MAPESARLFALNFTDWRGILPYFEALPALGRAEFQALADFTAAREHIAEWHPLAALIVLGRAAGSLDDAAAARAWGDLNRTLTAPHPDPLAALRAIVGTSANLDDAVAAFLRLTPPRRAAFTRVRELLNAPASPAAFVYAALLDPDVLLINEDCGVLARHVYSAPKLPLFQPAALVASSGGSHFAGGFAGFAELARTLARTGTPAESAAPAPAPSAPVESGGPATLFHADARLVEAHTTVTDTRGRYVDGLRAADFTILENRKVLPIAAFENGAAPISCALLLDTSQSMDTAIAALKSAALQLINALRPGDTVAIYSLNGGISLLQNFSTDKAAATRAVLRAELGSNTALYDGLVRVNRDLNGRVGRKVIVVFTDGEDNASTLTAGTAILRAKTAGVPIYTVAQGHAVRNQALLKDLAASSQATVVWPSPSSPPGRSATSSLRSSRTSCTATCSRSRRRPPMTMPGAPSKSACAPRGLPKSGPAKATTLGELPRAHNGQTSAREGYYAQSIDAQPKSVVVVTASLVIALSGKARIPARARYIFGA
jgi:hypothetical protein